MFGWGFSGMSWSCICNQYTRLCNWPEKCLIRISGSTTSMFPPSFAFYCLCLDDWMAPLHIATSVQDIIGYNGQATSLVDLLPSSFMLIQPPFLVLPYPQQTYVPLFLLMGRLRLTTMRGWRHPVWCPGSQLPECAKSKQSFPLLCTNTHIKHAAVSQWPGAHWSGQAKCTPAWDMPMTPGFGYQN